MFSYQLFVPFFFSFFFLQFNIAISNINLFDLIRKHAYPISFPGKVSQYRLSTTSLFERRRSLGEYSIRAFLGTTKRDLGAVATSELVRDDGYLRVLARVCKIYNGRKTKMEREKDVYKWGSNT